MSVWPNGSHTIPRVTSKFGRRVSPGGIGSTNHLGIDLRCNPLKSAVAGRVAFSQYNGGSGNEVRIDGDDGRQYRYKHMSRRDVGVGARVGEGQQIGLEGATGAVTGPHVHFEVLINGVQVNPENAIGPTSSPAGSVGGKFSQDTLNRQNWLRSRGWTWLANDGVEGPKTRQAYKEYQSKLRDFGFYKGAIDGVWGPATQAAHQRHYDDVNRPSPAPAPSGGKGTAAFGRVDVVQSALRNKYPAYAGRLVVDNQDGPATKAAVSEFQRRSGLKVDGIAGPATRARLGV